MEVKLDKRYPVAASVEQAWAVLCDVRATAACMPGAAITEQLDDTHYKGTVRSKVGPAVMQFAGEIEVLGLDAAARRLKMLGKGADKAGSSAAMELTAHLEPGDAPGTATLVGSAVVTVSGKLAQFGSRLLVPVSDAMLAQFAGNFSNAAAAVALAPAAADAAATPMTDSAEPGAQADAAALPTTLGAEAAALPAAATTTAPAPASPVLANRPPAPVNELNALGLLWTVIKGWLAGLFGRRRT